MKTPQDRDLNPNKNPLRAHGLVRHSHQAVVALSASLWLALMWSAGADQMPCTQSSAPPSNTPIPDLGQTSYSRGGGTAAKGGLYPNGYNQRPTSYEATGVAVANTIAPIGGKIVMISIGMCNTTEEFGGTLGGTTPTDGFQCRVTGTDLPNGHDDPCIYEQCTLLVPNWKNNKLVVIDCAQSGKDAKAWADPNNLAPWTELDCRLAAFGATRAQVQVVWLKEAMIQPGSVSNGDWPGHVIVLKNYLEQILDRLGTGVNNYGFTNLKMVFLSPRTHAWTTTDDHSPEPYAYETGFADQFVIKDKINGQSNWPWICWGPYLWVDGNTARSDGLMWPADLLQSDCTHPRTQGVHIVADQLLAFFKTDPVARTWFLRPPDNTLMFNVTTACGGPVDCSNINAGTTVTFTASPPTDGRQIAEYAWTFDDGTYHFDSANPTLATATKTFNAPSGTAGGPYQVHCTAIDTSGNVAFADTAITVNPTPTPPGPRQGSAKDKKDKAAKLPEPKPKTAKKVVTR